MPDVQEQTAKDALKAKIDALPPALVGEVDDFVDFVAAKRGSSPGAGEKGKGGRTLRQDWKGGLSHLKDEFTSVELKDKALEWWAEAAQK